MQLTSISAERVLAPEGWLNAAEVRFEEGRFCGISQTSKPTDFAYLAPGFVDIQVNGFADVDLASSPPEEWPKLAPTLSVSGVTSWLPTLISQPLDAYGRWLEELATFADHRQGPRVLGAHLEGPWLGELTGAHQDVATGPVDLEWCRSLPPNVRLITLGPERAGVIEAISYLTQRGIVVAAGHSSADYAAAQQAFDAGVSLLTHCFNASTPIHHRKPGLTAAALASDDTFISIIADGEHLHPDILKVAVRAKSPAKTILISDSAGWAKGNLGATKISLVGGVPRTPDGGLAGSCLTLDAAVKYVVEHCVMGLDDALRSASCVPAELLGETDIGLIKVGAWADLVAFDDSLEVRGVWCQGTQIA